MANSNKMVNFLITLVGKKRLKQIRKTTFDPKKHQMDFLFKMISEGKNTKFGKEHNFNEIKNYKDFCKNVPIRDYDAYVKYIDMLKKGEADVLFKGKPILYNTSSGTTGSPKLVPISEKFYKQLTAFNKYWMYSILEKNETVFSGKSLSSIGKAVEDYTEDGVPIGSISGSSFQTVPSILKKDHSSIYPFFTIDDYYLRYYGIARKRIGTQYYNFYMPKYCQHI